MKKSVAMGLGCIVLGAIGTLGLTKILAGEYNTSDHLPAQTAEPSTASNAARDEETLWTVPFKSFQAKAGAYDDAPENAQYAEFDKSICEYTIEGYFLGKRPRKGRYTMPSVCHIRADGTYKWDGRGFSFPKYYEGGIETDAYRNGQYTNTSQPGIIEPLNPNNGKHEEALGFPSTSAPDVETDLREIARETMGDAADELIITPSDH